MMKVSNNTFLRCCGLLLAILFISATAAFAQEKTERMVISSDFCSNHNYSSGNDRVSFKETREMTVRAGNLLNVDGGKNGGVKVRGENRADVLVRACVQTQGATDEAAQAMARNIRIETSPNVRAENSTGETTWAVSYEILVPRSTNLKLATHNGGISINGVEGTIEFEALNGGISLKDVAGDVKGRTKNGGVSVTLSGNSWKGAGLDVETTNGGVHLTMPESYAANIQTKTVNGGFKSEISQLSVERKDKERNFGANINANLNGGGAPIRVVTTNGGVKISSSTKDF
jgi:hypothetical protein